jgi:hypothetical protein
MCSIKLLNFFHRSLSGDGALSIEVLLNLLQFAHVPLWLGKIRTERTATTAAALKATSESASKTTASTTIAETTSKPAASV